MRYNHRAVLLATVASLAMPMAAFAQVAPVPGEGEIASPTYDGDAIVVTAQNRVQDVQDVPIAINVIGADELSNAGFDNANDLDKIAPAVNISNDQGAVKISVRGVGTLSADEAQDTSVVTNIDGEYINRPNVLSSALFDLERVEVLRGPQGTLYGRNSTGGAVNFITRKPGDAFAVNGSVSYGNYEAIKVDAGVDVPLGSDAGLRFAGFFEDRDGYVKHPAFAGQGPIPAYDEFRSGDNRAYGGRASFALDTASGLSVNVSGDYTEQQFAPQAFAFRNLNAGGNGPSGPGCNSQGFEQVAPGYNETLCIPSRTNFLNDIDRGEYQAPAYGAGELNLESWAVRGRIAYEFSPAATLSYIGGYRNFDGGDSFVTLPIVFRTEIFADDVETQSHELRLSGDIGRLTYQVGGFYFNEQLYNERGFYLPFLGPQGGFLTYFKRGVDSDSYSAFGQVEYELTNTLTAVGGLRYTENSRVGVYQSFGPPETINSGIGRITRDDPTPLNLSSDDNKITWLAGLNYQPDEDTLLYAKVSTGFKAGGFDSVGSFAPETNKAYEVGLKKSFGSYGQHILNLNSFYYDYRNLQNSVVLDSIVGPQVFNAGEATIWGAEVETALELSEFDLFTASVSYLNSEYDQFRGQTTVFCVGGCSVTGISDLDPNTPGLQSPDFSGNTTPFSPEWTIQVGYEHRFDLGNAGEITARAGTTFKSEYFTDFYNYNDSRQKAFTSSDATLEYKPVDGKYRVLLFARNLEGVRPLAQGYYIAAGSDDIYNWQFGTPRTYGIKLSFDY